MKTKYNLLRTCLLLLALLLRPTAVQAQFRFTTNANNTITINLYTGSDLSAIIPATTNGLPVTTIAAGAFTSSGITNVFIPYTVTNIGSGLFGNTLKLTAINIDSQNPLWCSMDGVWFSKDLTTLIQFPEAKYGYTIPNTVTNIGSSAFIWCSKLTNVIIPNSVISIGNSAFQICNLTNITIPNGVTSIGSAAFYECYQLASVKIANSVTNIGDSAFRDCHGLTSITLPNSITSLAVSIFGTCISLTSLTIPSSVTNMGNQSLIQCSSLNAVYFQGNAPSASDVFHYSGSMPIVYYLPGTTNWGATFGAFPASRPTMLWNPQTQTSDGSFGVQSNQFGFNINGNSNLVIVVEAATNLVNPVWDVVGTNTLNTFIGTNGASYFSDPQWTNYPGRFYRLRSP